MCIRDRLSSVHRFHQSQLCLMKPMRTRSLLTYNSVMHQPYGVLFSSSDSVNKLCNTWQVKVKYLILNLHYLICCLKNYSSVVGDVEEKYISSEHVSVGFMEHS